MYHISKDKGNNQNITLVSEDRTASVIIGKLTMDIIRILEKEVKFGETEDGALRLTDAWDFDISTEAGVDLQKITSPIKRPVRVNIKSTQNKSEQAAKTKTKTGREVVDVFDLIFGTE